MDIETGTELQKGPVDGLPVELEIEVVRQVGT
jgi:hypothetical protein